jgi:acetyl-CoA carboxylase carboxyl transferase subunit beta
MAWFSKRQTLKAQLTPDKPSGPVPAKKGEGLWTKCDGCGEVIYTQEWEGNWNVCPGCGHHDALPARRRLEMVLDPDSFEELDTELVPEDPLGFTDAKKYRDRLKSLQGHRPS